MKLEQLEFKTYEKLANTLCNAIKENKTSNSILNISKDFYDLIMFLNNGNSIPNLGEVNQNTRRFIKEYEANINNLKKEIA